MFKYSCWLAERNITTKIEFWLKYSRDGRNTMLDDSEPTIIISQLLLQRADPVTSEDKTKSSTQKFCHQSSHYLKHLCVCLSANKCWQLLEAILVVYKFPDVDSRLSRISSEPLRVLNKVIELGIRRFHIYTLTLAHLYQQETKVVGRRLHWIPFPLAVGIRTPV